MNGKYSVSFCSPYLQVLCLPLNSLRLFLKKNLRDYVQNLTDSEWKVSETCVLASLNREKVKSSKKLKGCSLSWRTPNCILLYRYWWNTRIFPFTKKSFLHRAQWRYYFYLSRLRILVSPWLLTWSANYQRTSRSGRFFCCYRIFLFFIRILTFLNAVKFFKPFCCLLLLSGSSHPLVSTIEVELVELLKQLQKWRKEGEYIMRV